MLTFFQLGYLTADASIAIEVGGNLAAAVDFDELAWESVEAASILDRRAFYEGRMARCLWCAKYYLSPT